MTYSCSFLLVSKGMTMSFSRTTTYHSLNSKHIHQNTHTSPQDLYFRKIRELNVLWTWVTLW